MRIKHSVKIAAAAAAAADQMGLKPSRYGWGVRSEQAERLARMLEEERPSTRKPKAGLQGLPGRVRAERPLREEFAPDVVEGWRFWGVVLRSRLDGRLYVTTGVADRQDGSLDTSSVIGRSPTDPIVGLTTGWEDPRFTTIKWNYTNNLHKPFFRCEVGQIIEVDNTEGITWYIPTWAKSAPPRWSYTSFAESDEE